MHLKRHIRKFTVPSLRVVVHTLSITPLLLALLLANTPALSFGACFSGAEDSCATDTMACCQDGEMSCCCRKGDEAPEEVASVVWAATQQTDQGATLSASCVRTSVPPSSLIAGAKPALVTHFAATVSTHPPTCAVPASSRMEFHPRAPPTLL